MASRLSLCMIVRDEEELLPAFLERARGLWDELVIVDTGSRDRTRAIAAAAGARVLSRRWEGDFAAARNASLDSATGDFVLYLDADEMATPSFVASARSLLGDPGAGAATVVLRNHLPHGRHRDSRLLRLFRRDPSIRFRHAIHEDASEGVAAYLEATGLRLAHLDGHVDHLGYVRSRAAAKDKKARDVALLEKCLHADPLDLYSHYKRLEQARFWRDRALWKRAAVDAAEALRDAPGRVASAPFAGELVALVADGLHPGSPPEALRLLDAWEARFAPSAAFHLRRGELREAAGRPDLARADFERCRSLAAPGLDLELGSVRPALGLMRLALAQGELSAALSLANEALAHSPRDPEALLAAVALRRARGGRGAVLAFAAAHARSHGDSVELDEAVGEEALRCGDLALALSSLAKAAGNPPGGTAGVGLAVARLASGDLDGARALSQCLSQSRPEAVLVEVLCDLCQGQSSERSVDFDRDEAERELGKLAAVLSGAARPEVRALLLRGVPALAGQFPSLPAAFAGRPPLRPRSTCG